MTNDTSLPEISGMIECGSKAQQMIADTSDMVSETEKERRTERICDMLLLAVSRLETVGAEKISSAAGQLRLMKTLDGLADTEKEAAQMRIMLDTALTELYKQSAMLECLRERLEKATGMLIAAEEELFDVSGKLGNNASAMQLAERRKKDIAASKLLAANCMSIIDRKYVELQTLAEGINTLTVNTLPLWRAQLADAARRCSADDINRSIDTGSAFAAAVRETVRKFISRVNVAGGK